MRISGCGGRAAGRGGLSVVLGETESSTAPLPPDALPHLRGAAARASTARLTSPSALRLSCRDTNYRFLALPAYCLIIYASFADTAALSCGIFSFVRRGDASGASLSLREFNTLATLIEFWIHWIVLFYIKFGSRAPNPRCMRSGGLG